MFLLKNSLDFFWAHNIVFLQAQNPPCPHLQQFCTCLFDMEGGLLCAMLVSGGIPNNQSYLLVVLLMGIVTGPAELLLLPVYLADTVSDHGLIPGNDVRVLGLGELLFFSFVACSLHRFLMLISCV